MSLYISSDGRLLFSGGADSVVNVGAGNDRSICESSLTLTRSGPPMISNVSTLSTPPKTWATFSLLFTLQTLKPFSVVRKIKVSRFGPPF